MLGYLRKIAVGSLDFLRQNWLWIAVPFGVAAILVAMLLVLSEGGEESAFIYNVF